MRRHITRAFAGLVVAAGLATGVAGATATAASAATTNPPVKAPPIQSNSHHPLFLYVDTVEGAGGNPAPAAACAMTNLFAPGQLVVFRMWGVDATTGGLALTQSNVEKAFVHIPGLAPIPFTYGAHGKVAFWTAAWSTKGYPPGIVNFTVTVIAKPIPKTATHPAIPAQSTVFSEAGTAPTSQLTIT
jgi:hypothetical protein